MADGPRWGIIGDGQLARMLAIEACAMGIRPVVLTSDPDSPAAQVSPLQVPGKLNNCDDLRTLLNQVDGAVIESEFIDCDALEATGLAHKVFPAITAIKVLQNKLQQKKLLRTIGLLTSDFYEAPKDADSDALRDWFRTISDNGTKPIVLKFATLGYDGKGVLVLDGQGSSDLARAANFIDLAQQRGIRVFAEDKIPFEKELAMIAVRGRDGSVKTWPLVISEQRQGICEKVMGPATRLGVRSNYEDQARAACESIGAQIKITGVYALEFFLTGDGHLFVNEIAPRVHNSGHYTQDAGCASQFQNHWRAVLSLPLGNTTTGPGFFAMQNLLGPPGSPTSESVPPSGSQPAITIHWYGKKTSSPGRKLGHVNGYTPDFQARDEVLSALQETRRKWQEDQMHQNKALMAQRGNDRDNN